MDAAPEQTAAFDRALRPLIPLPYEIYGLGCTVDYLDGEGEEGCDIMKEGNPVPDDLEYLVYYFDERNAELRKKFNVARDRVMRQFPQARLTLTFRRHEEAPADCASHPQPCAAAPYCPQHGSCSATVSSCKRC